ncbi:MAG TPA: serine hydrolase domain-containing protein [Mycobacteriales bacterium]|nr:serine hydrolase domain-containing protein [Mycobacteriales bacterium]
MDVTTLQGRLDELREKSGVPGAVVAVQHDGTVTEAASGVLDVETQRPVTTDTVFHLASVTKVYTATLVMTLVDEGLLDLDLPVTTYLPDFVVPDADAAARLTTRHLLTHTSGLDGDKFDSFGRGDDALERYVASCSTIGQVHTLGATWSYCNSGLNIAGRVVEALTGKSWDDALRERVLDPIGATRSGTLPEDVLWWPFATPHVEGSDGRPTPMRTWQGDRASGPCGGVVSSARDVLRFAAMHDDGGLVDGTTRVLSETAVAEMARPHFTLPDGTGEATHAGLGWSITALPDGKALVGHGGDLVGTHAVFERVPADRFAVVVLANGDGIDQIAEPLLDELLAEIGVARPEKPRIPEARPDVDIAARAGVFRTVAVELTLEPAADHLAGTIRIRDTRMAEMFPESQRVQRFTLHPVTEDRWLAQLPGAKDLTPGVFSESAGRRYLHLGGRAFVGA